MPRWGTPMKPRTDVNATVADGGNHLVVEDGAVGEPVDAVREVLQNPRGHIVAAAHNDIGPKRLDQGVVGLEVSAMTVSPSALANCTT